MEQPPQFKGKDLSANPQNINRTGKNKGHKWASTRLRELLEANNAEGLDKVLKSLLKQVEKGNVLAIKEALDRIEGKVTQEVKNETEVSGGLTIRIIESGD